MTPTTSSRPVPVDRRTFLKVGALGLGTLASDDPRDQGESVQERSLIDVNIYLSQWPFRRLPHDATPDLVAKLRAQGVSRAWAGSFDALLHRDLAGVNARLAEECRRHGDGLLVPFGAVNPRLPDWEEDLRRCHEEHGMPGIRLHPNYHQYPLDAPEFARLLDLASERQLIVQIAVTMEDERTQHPLVQVPHVDVTPLVAHARRLPRLPLVLLNAFRSLRVTNLGTLAEAGHIAFDIAMLEMLGGVADLIRHVPTDRVLFGSYAPFFEFESALFKLKESPLDDAQHRAIAAGNARKILTAR